MKIGTEAIPDNRLPDLIEIVKTIYGRWGSEEKDHETISRKLGHSTARSGAYRQKIADLRSYNLIESRGDVQVTDVGRKVSYPDNKAEEQEGLIEAVTAVPLWKKIYEKYTAKGLDLPSDFWTEIREWTGLAPEEAKNGAEIARKAYLEDIKYIRPEIKPENEGSNLETGKNNTNQAKTPEGIEQLTLGDNIKVWLPKGDKESAKKAIQLIKLYSGIED